LFENIGIPLHPSEWQFFTDSSSKSLKAVLIYNGNKFPSIPHAHSAKLKEEYHKCEEIATSIEI